jgi:hypothetical protein
MLGPWTLSQNATKQSKKAFDLLLASHLLSFLKSDL